MNCPICQQPMLPRHGSDGATQIGWICPRVDPADGVMHGVISRVLPERTTMDMAKVPPGVRARLGFAADGLPLSVGQLPADHPRRNAQAVAQAQAVDPDRPVG